MPHLVVRYCYCYSCSIIIIMYLQYSYVQYLFIYLRLVLEINTPLQGRSDGDPTTSGKHVISSNRINVIKDICTC